MRGGDTLQKDNEAIQPHPSTLNLIGCHDNDDRSLLPHHFPEVADGGRETALSGDVMLFRSGNFPRDIISIDVITANDIGVPASKSNSGMINYRDTVYVRVKGNLHANANYN